MNEIRIEILYFARLREEAGLAVESVETACGTAGELYAELRSRHGLSLAAENLGVAINDTFASFDSPLAAGDRVAFIPPVCGG